MSRPNSELNDLVYHIYDGKYDNSEQLLMDDIKNLMYQLVIKAKSMPTTDKLGAMIKLIGEL